ncbi:YhgE/Pip domain-containing protein [Adlercreutzia equolifaciens]|uniref:YhgE/Pip domain-containing protein n=1 Tax=Adlercreutzia equolifaciens TaxID=446660 RepID=UPI0023AF8445|nr:YhgE/Pip domain-containing protein [Adlercreutzia equolifaciens]MDE8703318.1 YhgE/Pip domain-containing protein [Adlercreutzia equolifaciens]
MLNVLRILKRDILRLLKTPPALVVYLALLILPSVYTWYNVVGFWNPYENTGNLHVCVVNQDQGGSSDLTGTLNVGDRIVDQLHENKQLDWTFMDYDTAMDELQSGRAYAAFVIPEDFTADLLTITTGDFTQPKLQYYVNEKSGPVAPKITDTGASTLDETINSTFVSTVADVAVKAIDDTIDGTEESARATRSKAAQKIANALDTMGEVRTSLEKVDKATGAAKQKAKDARGALKSAEEKLSSVQEGLGSVASQSSALQTKLTEFSAAALPAVQTSLEAATTAASKADEAAASLASTTGQAQGAIQAALIQGQTTIDEGKAMASSLRELAGKLPADSAVRKSLEEAAATIDDRTATAQETLDSLKGLNTRTLAASQALSEATAAVNSAVQQATGGANDYATVLFGSTVPAVNEALDALARSADGLQHSLDSQSLVIDQTYAVLDQLDHALDTAAHTVGETDGLFASLEKELKTVQADVTAFGESGALAKLIDEGGLDPQKIASFMASPTEVVTEQLYPLNAYGSAMAPLFMNLTFWIGAFMLLVVMRQEVDSEGIPNLTLGQRYWGRFLFLAVMAVMQAVICCTGVLVLGVEAANPPALFAAAALASLAYLSIIYSLSVTLQHIGKGICIVLVFAQIPGATGLYPIEMTSPFFQAIYPFFPFTYGIGSMREAICGFYGTQFVSDLMVLALFLVVGLAFGLLVRPLMANVNLMVARQVREGGIFNGEDVQIPVRPYRISQILNVLTDKQAYRVELNRRYERFTRWYPRIMRAALILGVAVPVAIVLVFALTPTEKVWILTFTLLWLVVIFVALVVVESMRYSFERQRRLEDIPEETLLEIYDARTTMKHAEVSTTKAAMKGSPTGEEDHRG